MCDEPPPPPPGVEGIEEGVDADASLRERLDLAQVPKPFQGVSIALITAGILAMAFMGFSGLV